MNKYIHFLKIRKYRLLFIAAFLFTFIGLPSIGQYLQTDVFQAFDILELYK